MQPSVFRINSFSRRISLSWNQALKARRTSNKDQRKAKWCRLTRLNRITRLDLKLHPYRMHIRHQLLPQDYAQCMQFARWLVDRYARNEEFLRPFVIGDEAAFAMNGQVNTQNVREYAAVGTVGQPPEFNFDVNISREKLTVWVGLCGNGQIIGPFFFNRNIDGLNYLQMINNDVIPQLQQHFQRQAEGAFRNLCWVQDGAPHIVWLQLVSVYENCLFNASLLCIIMWNGPRASLI